MQSAQKVDFFTFVVVLVHESELVNIIPQSLDCCVEGPVFQAVWHMLFQPHPCAVKGLRASQVGRSRKRCQRVLLKTVCTVDHQPLTTAR